MSDTECECSNCGLMRAACRKALDVVGAFHASDLGAAQYQTLLHADDGTPGRTVTTFVVTENPELCASIRAVISAHIGREPLRRDPKTWALVEPADDVTSMGRGHA